MHISSTRSLPSLPTYRGANHTPTHLDLMNKIATSIPTRWRDIGLQLGLSTVDLDIIEARYLGEYNRCFSCVFSAWEKQLTRPYTWCSILQALRSPMLAEHRLAEEIQASLVHMEGGTRYRDLLECYVYVGEYG